MKTEIFYINIADFTIKIVLKDCSDLKQKKLLTDGIKSFFEGFISYSPKKDADYIIEVDELLNSTEMQMFRGEKHYVLFYEKLNKKRLRTFFSISIFQFQLVIQNVLYQLLSQTNGFLLHSSASKVRNSAYIFLGISGAGKSTSVQLLKNAYPPLSDDLSIIRKRENTYFYYQHPFKESHFIENKASSGLKVGKVFLLTKAQTFSFTKLLDKEKRCQILIQQLFSPNKNSAKDALEFGIKFQHFYNLNFAKEERGMIALIGKAAAKNL